VLLLVEAVVAVEVVVESKTTLGRQEARGAGLTSYSTKMIVVIMKNRKKKRKKRKKKLEQRQKVI
jgi:hypothetical protein